MELVEHRGGLEEKALNVGIWDTASESQMVVFFTTDDCDPDHVIEEVWLDDDCSGKFANKLQDWKSWAVWDMCEGDVGCDLGIKVF